MYIHSLSFKLNLAAASITIDSFLHTSLSQVRLDKLSWVAYTYHPVCKEWTALHLVMFTEVLQQINVLNGSISSSLPRQLPFACDGPSFFRAFEPFDTVSFHRRGRLVLVNCPKSVCKRRERASILEDFDHVLRAMALSLFLLQLNIFSLVFTAIPSYPVRYMAPPISLLLFDGSEFCNDSFFPIRPSALLTAYFQIRVLFPGREPRERGIKN